ncbi:MAG: hypothetical protein U5J96_02055 [Ignavibacteriaceae bacterium]|nr:hypothetical protein [Ignavibacteriaceae bacterium]
MKTDERIIKYLENELSPEERNLFEADLDNSVELKEEFEKYLKVNAETDELKKLKLNSLYLNSFIPEFRKKLDAPKSVSVKRNLGYAFGIMLIFILSISILKNFFSSESPAIVLQEFTQSLNENQKIELLEDLNGDAEVYKLLSENISDNELTNLLTTELEINNEVAEAYDISFNELIVGVSQQKIDEIYAEILNRKF